jgi:hypothetical protein
VSESERIREYLAELGPLVEGLSESQRASKIHAVRVNQDHAWCGRWKVHAITPHRPWRPATNPPSVYCGQCFNVWSAAVKRNEQVENFITEVERLIIEGRRRASA